MIKLIIILTSTLALTVGITQYKVVPTKADVRFTLYEKNGVEEGVLTGLTGEMIWDSSNLAQCKLTASIPVSTINSGIEERDAILRGKDFFDVAKYPTINIKSTKITKTDTGYTAACTLSAKQVSKPIQFYFKQPILTDTTSTLQGYFIINRLQWGIGSKTDGIGTKVKIDVTVPVVKAG